MMATRTDPTGASPVDTIAAGFSRGDFPRQCSIRTRREVAMDPIVDEVTGAIARVDVEALRAAYREQNEFVYVERWLPPALVERLRAAPRPRGRDRPARRGRGAREPHDGVRHGPAHDAAQAVRVEHEGLDRLLRLPLRLRRGAGPGPPAAPPPGPPPPPPG